jgi:hypothetical protein
MLLSQAATSVAALKFEVIYIGSDAYPLEAFSHTEASRCRQPNVHSNMDRIVMLGAVGRSIRRQHHIPGFPTGEPSAYAYCSDNAHKSELIFKLFDDAGVTVQVTWQQIGYNYHQW